MEVGGKLHVSAAILSGKIAPRIHRIGSWVDPGAGLDAAGKRKFPAPGRENIA